MFEIVVVVTFIKLTFTFTFSSYDIAEIINIAHISFVRNLKPVVYVNSYDVWKLQDLMENN